MRIALALWPKKPREEPTSILPLEPEKWDQEQEVHKRRLQTELEHPRERLERLLPGLDLKRLAP